MVMMDAQQTQIVEIRRTAVRFPTFDVMGVRERHVRTAREPAMSVPPPHLAALRSTRVTAAAPFVHRPACVIVDGQRDGGVADDPLHGGRAEQAVSLELPREV
jgi:hypothetical protein